MPSKECCLGQRRVVEPGESLGTAAAGQDFKKSRKKKKKKRGEGKKYPKQNKPHGEAGAKAHQERMISKGTTAEAR